MVFCFLGATEVAIILIIALLVFGPQKLPEVGKQIGSVWREMNRMRNDVERMLDIDDYNNRYDRTPYYTPNETIYPQISGPLEDPEKTDATAEHHGSNGIESHDATHDANHSWTTHDAGASEGRLIAASDAHQEHSAVSATVEVAPETAAPAAKKTRSKKKDSSAATADAQEQKNDV